LATNLKQPDEAAAPASNGLDVQLSIDDGSAQKEHLGETSAKLEF
jgi:hypothetical protein